MRRRLLVWRPAGDRPRSEHAGADPRQRGLQRPLAAYPGAAPAGQMDFSSCLDRKSVV